MGKAATTETHQSATHVRISRKLKVKHERSCAEPRIPVGVNYLLGKDGKNYFEIGAGFTYVGGSSKDEFNSENFSSSFGNLTLGYRLSPTNGGFIFKAQITPVFGRGFFIPYYAGLGFGYKF